MEEELSSYIPNIISCLKIGFINNSNRVSFTKAQIVFECGQSRILCVLVSVMFGHSGQNRSCMIFIMCKSSLVYRLSLRMDICISLGSGTVEVLYTLLMTLASSFGRNLTSSSLSNFNSFISWGHLL